LCFGASAVANDVPPPPEASLPPSAIFSDETDASPVPSGDGTVSPNAVYSAPAARRYYYTPASSQPDNFRFAGYNGGMTMAIGGTVDELFNAGIQFVAETGWQQSLGNDGAFSDVAFTIGLSNQTLFGKDQRSIVLPDGTFRGLETLSINTVKFGAYAGTSLGGIDVFTGVYGKIGAAVLNEDREFFDPLVEYTPIEEIHPTALAGGVGVETGLALMENERSSLALIGGVEYMYLGTFDNPSPSTTLFVTTGLQYEVDITDGLFPDRDRCPRERKQRGRRCRR
jgi:hypothetical protein